MDTSLCIGVAYTCTLCGIKDREVSVPARGDEDVVSWLQNVCIPALEYDHACISPECGAQELTNLMIPLSGADRIGGVIRS